jgi:uncharacterized membrane protein
MKRFILPALGGVLLTASALWVVAANSDTLMTQSTLQGLLFGALAMGGVWLVATLFREPR